MDPPNLSAGYSEETEEITTNQQPSKGKRPADTESSDEPPTKRTCIDIARDADHLGAPECAVVAADSLVIPATPEDSTNSLSPMAENNEISEEIIKKQVEVTLKEAHSTIKAAMEMHAELRKIEADLLKDHAKILCNAMSWIGAMGTSKFASVSGPLIDLRIALEQESTLLEAQAAHLRMPWTTEELFSVNIPAFAPTTKLVGAIQAFQLEVEKIKAYVFADSHLLPDEVITGPEKSFQHFAKAMTQTENILIGLILQIGSGPEEATASKAEAVPSPSNSAQNLATDQALGTNPPWDASITVSPISPSNEWNIHNQIAPYYTGMVDLDSLIANSSQMHQQYLQVAIGSETAGQTGTYAILYDVAVNGLGEANTTVWQPPSFVEAESTAFDAIAFVESLEEVDISTIPADASKCPHCWLPFGMTDDATLATEDIDDNEAEANLSAFHALPFDQSLPNNDPVRTPCGHIFGRSCLIESLEKTSTLCPLCRTNLTFNWSSGG